MLEAGVLIQKGAEVVVAELTKRAIGLFKSGAPAGRQSKELDFSKHFAYAYDRCTNIRTILKPDSQIKLLSCYVNLNHKIENKIIDDFEIIDLIQDKKRIIVTGEGGGGKSMFMRYLWIAMAENVTSRIPIFVELKNLKSEFKLLEYLYYTSAPSEDSDGMIKYLQMMRDGKFIFILDGFDELKIGIREKIQTEIFDISDEYSKNIFVVSGRSDDRYNGWSRFIRSKVCPLNKKQTLQLLERVDYPYDITSEFIAKVKSDAFEPQKSFLERPLLLCMMLVTYKHFREIPSKLHLFYSNAFDALYREHDSYKDGFKRDLHVKIQPDVFRKILGYTSLITYKDQKIEFQGHELLEYINKAIKASGVEIKSQGFLDDLIESVCVIQKEGTVYSYVHRSFQEYFAAECLSGMDTKMCGPLLEEFSRRSTDNVIVMLHDINDQLVMNSFILKFLTNKRKIIGNLASAATFADTLAVTNDRISGHIGIKKVADGTYNIAGLMMYSPMNLSYLLSTISIVMQCCNLDISREARKIGMSGSFDQLATEISRLSVFSDLFPGFKQRSISNIIYQWEPKQGYSVSIAAENADVTGQIESDNWVYLPAGGKDENILDEFLTAVFLERRHIVARCQRLKRAIPSIRRKQKAFDALMGDILTVY